MGQIRPLTEMQTLWGLIARCTVFIEGTASMQETKDSGAQARPVAPKAAPRPEQGKDATLTQIRDLIYGESKRELDEHLNHLIDRQREFEELTRREMRKIADEQRSAERRAEEARRAMLKDLSETVDAMAKSIAKLAE
jgi:flagellar hook-basal body complex protein FliE